MALFGLIPEKKIDTSLVKNLQKQGLSNRAIAIKLGVKEKDIPKQTFEVGEGLTPEQKIKAEEIVRKEPIKTKQQIIEETATKFEPPKTKEVLKVGGELVEEIARIPQKLVTAPLLDLASSLTGKPAIVEPRKSSLMDRILIGKYPVKGFSYKVEEAGEIGKGVAQYLGMSQTGQDVAQFALAPLVVAGITTLDVYPGSGKATKKIIKDVAQEIAEKQSVDEIVPILKQVYKASDEELKPLAESVIKLSKITDTFDFKGVEAKKYKSAEEFVEAQQPKFKEKIEPAKVEDVFKDQIQVKGEWYNIKLFDKKDFKIGDTVKELSKTTKTKIEKPDFKVESDLFRESGANILDTKKLEKYVKDMREYGGYGKFPPISGRLDTITKQDVLDYKKFGNEKAYSRPITEKDIGKEIVNIEEGHHRAYAAKKLGVDIPVFDLERQELTKQQLKDIWKQAQEVKPVDISDIEKLLGSVVKQKKSIKPSEYLELRDIRLSKLREATKGEIGAAKQIEIEQNILKRDMLNNDIVKGIKNNPYWKKEKEIKDMMGRGWLMRKGDDVLVAEPRQVDNYLQKGWTKDIEIDTLAQEAGFDNGYDYLFNQIEIDQIPKTTNLTKAIEQDLLETDKTFVEATKKLSEIKDEVVPLKQYLTQKGQRERLERLVTERRNKVRAIRDYLGLSDNDLRKLNRKDIRLMDNAEFEKFLGDFEKKATQFAETRQAKNEVLDLISRREYKKVDNARQALNLPPIEKMSVEQLRQFKKFLEPYQVGDEFLSLRKLETVDRTDLQGIRTLREARERLAKELNIPIEDLNKIKVGQLDKFRYDTALARRNPFYQMMVDETNKNILDQNARYYDWEKELMDLAKKANKSRPRGILERAIPQNKEIVQYLESPQELKEILSKKMTSEELDLANFLQASYADALDYLVKVKSLEKGRENYFTHIRRSLLEDIKEDGFVQGFKNLFAKYKEDELVFNILDGDTENILPLEKFFQFSMRRTGELKPSENVIKTAQAYFKTLHKKKALDALIPKLDIYAHSITPQKLTPQGLEIDRSLKKFVNEWVNNKKGRRADFLKIPQGSTADIALRGIRMFTSLLDLGLNLGVGIATYMGEKATTYQLLGKLAYSKGAVRKYTKQGKMIVNKYKNFVGKSPWEEIIEPGKDVGDRLLEGLFIQFGDASRRANKTFLLGSLSEQEFKSGVIKPERLAMLKRELGRYRVVQDASSIIGSTSAGKIGTQYKTWAIPILSTTIDNFSKLSNTLLRRPGGLNKKEAMELVRLLEITSIALLTGDYVMSAEKDESLLGKIKQRVYRESMTLIGALDPSVITSEPRLLKFIGDLGRNLSSLLKLERYKTGEKKGELKGLEKIKQQFTPRAFKQLPKEEKTKSKGKLLF